MILLLCGHCFLQCILEVSASFLKFLAREMTLEFSLSVLVSLTRVVYQFSSKKRPQVSFSSGPRGSSGL